LARDSVGSIGLFPWLHYTHSANSLSGAVAYPDLQRERSKAFADLGTPKRKGIAVIKIQIELPEATARAAGLLAPQALERLLTNALRRQQAADYLLTVADEVAAASIEPMPMEEINAKVKAAREERRQGADRN
jgi:hypothetical protein